MDTELLTKREVKCYVTNNTRYAYYVQSIDNDHGEAEKEPQTIDPHANNEEIFYYRKGNFTLYGVTGSVTYKLQDNSDLVFVFNCPLSQDGQNGPGGFNCWFYAGLTKIPASGTSYAIECRVDIDGHPMDPANPPTGSTVTAHVTINLNS